MLHRFSVSVLEIEIDQTGPISGPGSVRSKVGRFRSVPVRSGPGLTIPDSGISRHLSNRISYKISNSEMDYIHHHVIRQWTAMPFKVTKAQRLSPQWKIWPIFSQIRLIQQNAKAWISPALRDRFDLKIYLSFYGISELNRPINPAHKRCLKLMKLG